MSMHKQLLDEGIDHELWIIGEGEERPKLEAYIRENHLETSAKLLGFRENPYNLCMPPTFWCARLYLKASAPSSRKV